MKIFGILNVTEDSFFDGGKYIREQDALEKSDELLSDGAYGIDVGAQSSNVSAKVLPWELEWQRLEPILKSLKAKKVILSVDTYKPEVIEKCIQANVDYINDITAFSDPGSISVLEKYKDHLPNLILMFSHNGGKFAEVNSKLQVESVVDTICRFLELRISELKKIGVKEETIIVDPGMGFFLGENPLLSIEVLKKLNTLKNYFPRILVSVSNKSFLGNLIGGVPPEKRANATLAAEIYIYTQKMEFIRTHNCKQIKEAIRIWDLLVNESSVYN